MSYHHALLNAGQLPAVFVESNSTASLSKFTYVGIPGSTNERGFYADNANGIRFGFIPADRPVNSSITLTGGYTCTEDTVFEYWCNRFTAAAGAGPFEVLINGVVMVSDTLASQSGSARNSAGIDLASTLIYTTTLAPGSYTIAVRKPTSAVYNIAVQRFEFRRP